MAFINLSIASIKMFFRDTRSLFFSVFLPVLFMMIFGIAQFDTFTNIKIGIIDNDQSKTSKEFIDNIKTIDVVTIYTDNAEDMKTKLKKGDLDIILELPKDLITSKMVPIEIPGLKLPPNVSGPQKPEFEKKELTLYTNEARKQQAENDKTILAQIFDRINLKLNGSDEIFSFKEVSLSNKAFKYIDFLVPGIVAMAIMQMGLMSIIFTIVGYREKDILKRLQITPIKSFDFIGSQVISRLIISILQVSVLVIIAVSVFNIIVIGSYWLMALLTILGATIFITMGIALSAVAKNQNTAAPLANIIMLPMMFLGGVFFPAETMPSWLQQFTKFLPLNYLSDALRKVMIDGYNISQINNDLYGLIAWVIILVLLATFAFRWKTID